MRPALTATAFLLVWLLLSTFLYSTWKDKESQLLAKYTAVLGTTYRASVKMYALATETLFEEVIQRPEVIASFAQGMHAEGAAQTQARGELYDMLASAYTHLQEKGIRQLHFHTAAGISYLRFHAPTKFGDPLFDVRPTVRIANTEKRPVTAFETGRIISGFRYVFPLFQGTTHLGSVETCIPFEAIRQAMAGIDPTNEYAMILRWEAVDQALFEEQKDLYETADMSSLFLVEDPHLRLPDSAPPPSPYVRQINAELKEAPRFQKQLAGGEAFIYPLILENESWVIACLPVKDILEKDVAYVLSYSKVPLVASLRQEFFLDLGLGSLTLVAFAWFTRGLLRSRKQLQEEKAHQLAITDTMADGLYVMDAQGGITQINPAFTALLGYREDEVLGKIGHDLFHVHGDGGSSVPLAQCPIYSATQRGQGYAGEELFRHENGRLLSVEVSCQPIRKNGLLAGSVTAFRDITERKAADERIRFLAQFDTLTSLPNRTLLHDRLQQAISSRSQSQEKFSILFLDLDHFKTINDSLGHHIGDYLLQQVAARLTACVRAGDTVCRHGGDEFVIVLRQIKNPTDCAHIAQKILTSITCPYHIEGNELHITGSIGIVLYPEDGADKATLIKHADSAMYHAKKNGRNNFQFFTQELNTRAFERLGLETSLRHALERNEFFLHYQPQVDLLTGAITGAEALIRWRHPEQGLIPPNRFIPIAEESGLIVPIGEWVLREVCQQCRSWQDAGLPLITVAVNLSALQFRQKNLEQTIGQILAEAGINAGCLEIELTESILMQDAKIAVETLLRLKEMGLAISIDDFGTGYSSLNYLKTFPLDRLKIDQSFVRDVSCDPNDAAIASAIIAMAHRLQLKVVAEGVETPEQLQFLLEEECDEAQGFYYSRPLTAECLEVLLRHNQPLPLAED